MTLAGSTVATRYSHWLAGGRIQCDVCPTERFYSTAFHPDYACGEQIPGVFAGAPGTWRPRRLPVRFVGR